LVVVLGLNSGPHTYSYTYQLAHSFRGFSS
jgi:hypothetical protein